MALEIQVLGRFRVVADGVEVADSSWTRRAARDLVKLLAVTPKHRLHREQIVDALWPDADPKAAANALYKCLHAARRAMEPDQRARGSSRFLITDGEAIALAEDVRIDAETFEAKASIAIRSRNPEQGEEALALYCGDLLPDDLYADWAGGPRDRCSAVRLRLLAALGERARSEGRLVDAIRHFESITLADPLDEEAHVALVELAGRAGLQHTAMRRFRECEQIFKREIDEEPSEEARSLAEQIARLPRPPIPESVSLASWRRRKRRYVVPAAGPWRRSTAVACAAAMLLTVSWSIITGSPVVAHKISRFVARTAASIEGSRRGDARLVTLRGVVTEPGARIDVLDSVSGWAGIADANGVFVVLDVEWRRRDRCSLVVSSGGVSRAIAVRLPTEWPADGIVDLGDLSLEHAPAEPTGVVQGITSVTYVRNPELDVAYFSGVFDGASAGAQTRQGQLEAVNAFVAARYSPAWTAESAGEPREVLATGSAQSGPLARLMATLCYAKGYEVRLVDVVDGVYERRAHVIVEVYYEGDWHAFDPSFGIVPHDGSDRVASLALLRQRPELIAGLPYAATNRPGWDSSRIPQLLSSGIRHDHYFTGISTGSPSAVLSI